MRTLKNKILIVAVLSMVLVACSKEEVKPFNSGGGAAAGFSTKTASGDVDNNDANSGVQSNGVTVTEDETGTGSGDDSGITDGGTSSDYDSKGTKRKPGKN